jgi:hypothetical protein
VFLQRFEDALAMGGDGQIVREANCRAETGPPFPALRRAIQLRLPLPQHTIRWLTLAETLLDLARPPLETDAVHQQQLVVAIEHPAQHVSRF